MEKLIEVGYKNTVFPHKASTIEAAFILAYELLKAEPDEVVYIQTNDEIIYIKH